MIDLTRAATPDLTAQPAYSEYLRVPDLSMGTYHLPAGSEDPQQPHSEDEIYIVTRGEASLWTPAVTVAVSPGSVVFVPAGEEHRFVDVRSDLTALVVFGPAEHSRGAKSP